MIKKKYGQDAVNVGDEGGFAPNIQVSHEHYLLVLYVQGTWILAQAFGQLLIIPYLLSVQENKEGLELLKTSIANAGYTGKVSFYSPIIVLYMVT